jgi:hypothetical protein
LVPAIAPVPLGELRFAAVQRVPEAGELRRFNNGVTPPAKRECDAARDESAQPAAFTAAPGSGYGDTPRNIARGPNLWQTDLGLARRIPLNERVQLQFRCETFNLFNRAQYSLPLEEIWLPPTGTSPSSIEPQVSTASTTPIGTGTPREIQFALRLEF